MFAVFNVFDVDVSLCFKIVGNIIIRNRVVT